MRSHLSTKSFQELEGEIREREEATQERRYWNGQVSTIDELEAVEMRMYMEDRQNDWSDWLAVALIGGGMVVSGLVFFGWLAWAAITTIVAAVA